MTVIAGKNFSHREPVGVSDGDSLDRCNISQLVPHTAVCAGITGLTFSRCNLANCQPPADSVVERCNTAQISRCSHEHPQWVEKGLAPCKEDCEHRQGATKQWVTIDEDEYREHFASIAPDKPAVRISKTVDAANVTQQTFEKEVFVYGDVRVGKWKPEAKQ